MRASVCRLSGVVEVLLSVARCAQPSVTASDTRNQSDDVVVRPSGQIVTLRQHQTLRIVRPADFAEWQVDYASDVLKPLASAEDMRSPGPDGWRFEAIGAGETEVVATPVVASAPNRASPPRFSITIRVQ